MNNTEVLELAAEYGLTNDIIGYENFEQQLLKFLYALLLAEEAKKCCLVGKCVFKDRNFAGNC